MDQPLNRSDAPSLSGREIALSVGSLMLVLFLVSLDQTILGAATPQIISELRGFEQYAWVTTAYLLAETVVIPIVGKLGDLYGRKWFSVGGVVIFLLGSALSGAAPSMWALVVFRGLQGLGGGMIFSTAFTTIADLFPDPARRARYQGLFFSVFALSSVVGPLIGGVITDVAGWRWLFYINLPLGLLALLLLARLLPQSQPQPGARIDVGGALTMIVAIVALLLGLIWVGEGAAWLSPPVLASFAIAAVFLLLFVLIERRVAEPILPLDLFRDRTMIAASLLGLVAGVALFGLILYTPLFVQGVQGRTATGSGAVLTPLVLTMTVAAIIGGQLMARWKRIKPFVIGGTLLIALGVGLMATIGVGTGTGTIGFFLFVAGVGLGLVQPTATLAVQTALPRQVVGVATSATQFIRSVGATLGTAIIGTFVTNGYVRNLTANAPATTPPDLLAQVQNPDVLVNADALQQLSASAVQIANGQQLADQLLAAARLALAEAIRGGFVFVLIVAAIGVVGAVLLPNLWLEQRSAPANEPAKTRSEGGAAAVAVESVRH
jgi:EmrB/QacA subfamily drug resistance transporter